VLAALAATSAVEGGKRMERELRFWIRRLNALGAELARGREGRRAAAAERERADEREPAAGERQVAAGAADEGEVGARERERAGEREVAADGPETVHERQPATDE